MGNLSQTFFRVTFRSVIALVFVVKAAYAGSEGREKNTKPNLIFYSNIMFPNGTSKILDLPIVANIPNAVCYGWRARVKPANKLVQYKEVLSLPSPPKFWSGEGDPYSTNEIAKDRKQSVTQKFASAKAGVIGNEWCVVVGDPSGNYSLEISIDGKDVGTLEFKLVDWVEFKKTLSRR